MSSNGGLVHNDYIAVGIKTRLERDEKQWEEKIPTNLMSDTDVSKLMVEYSTRSPTDYVISGPIGPEVDGGGGPGVRFFSANEAERHYRKKFGKRYKHRIKASEKGGRWAALISQ